jgi:hypothetical protein
VVNPRTPKNITDRTRAAMKDIEGVLKNHGLEGFEISSLRLSPSGQAPDPSTCNGHWEWKCEQTPHGVECHWVCVPG